MNKSIVILTTLFVSNVVFSQVGINTANPQGIFHVDGAKDNNATASPSVSQQVNDFIVLPSGNVGIGTTTPSQKLEITTGGTNSNPITGFKLTDGNQGVKKVLTSDVNGVGTWADAGIVFFTGTFGNIASHDFDIPFVSSPSYKVVPTAKITLPPGKYYVSLAQLLAYNGTVPLAVDDYIWIRFSLSDSPTSNNFSTDLPQGGSDSGKIVSGYMQGPAIVGSEKYSTVSGVMYITNNSGADKTYYLLAGNATVQGTQSVNKVLGYVGGSYRENTLTAMKIN